MLCRRFLVMLAADLVFQKVDWRGLFERSLAPRPFLGRFDGSKLLGRRSGAGALAGAMQPLSLHSIEEELRRSVSVATTFAAHRLEPVLLRPRPNGVGRTLVFPVGLLDQIRVGLRLCGSRNLPHRSYRSEIEV